MKRILAIVFFTIIGLNTAQVSAQQSESNDVALANSEQASSSTTTQEEIQAISDRVSEIKNMDKSNLTLAQRKELRQELVLLKEKSKKANAGIWIGSSAALILVIILLIVFL